MLSSRRDFLGALSAVGVVLADPAWAAAQARVSEKKILQGRAGRVLSADQVAFVDRVADLIIPPTDTPGASEAGVVGFIDRLLAEYEDPPGRTTFLEGLEDFRRRADIAVAPSFMKASEARQFAFLQAEDVRAAEAQRSSFFVELKRKVVIGYYTSEVGATQELLYLPVPGPFQPDVVVTGETRNYAL